PFLAKSFHERAPHPKRNIPVDVAHVVAGHVIAQFLEIHPAPLKMTQVGADHHVVDQPVGAYLDSAHAVQNFVEGHGGGGTWESEFLVPSCEFGVISQPAAVVNSELGTGN